MPSTATVTEAGTPTVEPGDEHGRDGEQATRGGAGALDPHGPRECLVDTDHGGQIRQNSPAQGGTHARRCETTKSASQRTTTSAPKSGRWRRVSAKLVMGGLPGGTLPPGGVTGRPPAESPAADLGSSFAQEPRANPVPAVEDQRGRGMTEVGLLGRRTRFHGAHPGRVVRIDGNVHLGRLTESLGAAGGCVADVDGPTAPPVGRGWALYTCCSPGSRPARPTPTDPRN